MPPKKAAAGKGKKKKVKKKKEGIGDELTVAELYRRTSQEVDSLKERLAERQAYARHARASEVVMRERMVEAKTVASEDKLMMKEISNDLTRQYKAMQTKLESRVTFLECQVRKQNSELTVAQAEIVRLTKERDGILKEKKEQEVDLVSKLNTMEKSYESIIYEAFDLLSAKIESARSKWDTESRLFEERAQQVLLEFGRGSGEHQRSMYSVPTN